MGKLRRFIIVSFMTEEHAKAALLETKSNFYQGVRANAHDFNHVKGNTVFFMSTRDSARDHKIKEFLLSQEGSLPHVCRFQVG